jgi:hypothetical protein
VWIAIELLLNQQGQAVEALAHVGVACGEPNADIAAKADHRRRSAFDKASITLASVPASGAPSIFSRAPHPNLIVIPDADGGFGARAGAGATVTETNTGRSRAANRGKADTDRRQRYKRLGSIPAARAKSATQASGSVAAKTNRSFSEREYFRRRSTDVMTSIRFMAMCDYPQVSHALLRKPSDS